MINTNIFCKNSEQKAYLLVIGKHLFSNFLLKIEYRNKRNLVDSILLWERVTLAVTNKIDLHTIKMDYLGIMLAAYETSAHIMLSSIYLLKKNPDKLKVLQNELKHYGVSKETIDSDNEILMEKIMECEYLTYVTKEALRMDPPIQFTLPYRWFEKVTIWGVPMRK